MCHLQGLAHAWVLPSDHMKDVAVNIMVTTFAYHLVEFSKIGEPGTVDALLLWKALSKAFQAAQSDQKCSAVSLAFTQSCKGFLRRLANLIYKGGVIYIQSQIERLGPKSAMDLVGKEMGDPVPETLTTVLQTFRVAAGWTDQALSVTGFKAEQADQQQKALQQSLTTFTKLQGLDRFFLKKTMNAQLEKAMLFEEAYKACLNDWVARLKSEMQDAQSTMEKLRPGFDFAFWQLGLKGFHNSYYSKQFSMFFFLVD